MENIPTITKAPSEVESSQIEVKRDALAKPDVVIVAGMGPVDLKDIKASERNFPNSAYARRNAQAAKILGARELSPKIIMSGYESNKGTHPGITEANLQADTYTRMRATFLPPELRSHFNTLRKQIRIQASSMNASYESA